eukprot:scaffold241148_cov18-Tisochrysis_lutea.AAC.2
MVTKLSLDHKEGREGRGRGKMKGREEKGPACEIKILCTTTCEALHNDPRSKVGLMRNDA